MQNNNVKAVKSGIWYTVSNFLIKGLSILTVPIFTRILTKEQFGDFNNYTSWQSILLILLTLNLDSTLISAKYDHDDFDGYISSMLALSSITTGAWLLCTNVFGDFFTNVLDVSQFTLNCMGVYLFFIPTINLFQARERYLFEYKKSVLISVGIALLTVLTSLIFVMSFNDRLAGRILGNVLPTVIIGVFLYAYLMYKGKNISLNDWKYALPICLPFIPHLLSMTVLGSTDRIMITKFCDSTATALYSLSYSISLLVSLLMSSLNGAFAPWLGNKLNEKAYKEIKVFAKWYVGVFCVLVVFIVLLAPEALLILGGEAYIEAKFVMPPVAMGCLCQFMYTLYVNVEQFTKNTKWMALASVSATILNVGLNYIFIPEYGYIATRYTTLVSYVWLLLAHMFIVKKIGYGFVYDNKWILVSVMFMGVVILLTGILYLNNVVRYLVVVATVLIAGGILVKNKKNIISTIKKVRAI